MTKRGGGQVVPGPLGLDFFSPKRRVGSWVGLSWVGCWLGWVWLVWLLGLSWLVVGSELVGFGC